MQFARTGDISMMSDGTDDEFIAPIGVGYRVATESGTKDDARQFDALQKII
jgi:hypothetical protein